MKKYISKTEFHCGIDLHKSMSYICVMNRFGEILLHKKIKGNDFEYMEKQLAPFLHSLTIACESTYNWYVLSDYCEDSKYDISFALGHALYMKHIHGGKAKNDRIDSQKIADLLRNNLLPNAYACPRQNRGLRDLLRRRIKLVRERAAILVYLSNFADQNSLKRIKREYTSIDYETETLLDFDGLDIDYSIKRNYEFNHAIIKVLVEETKKIDKDLKSYCLASELKDDFLLLKTIPGVGDILAMTILLETQDIGRFDKVGEYASYCRVIKCKKESAGKNYGYSGLKIGNSSLRWAFGQVAILSRQTPLMGEFYKDLTSHHKDSKARNILEHKMCRAVYYILQRKEPFDYIQFYGKNKYECYLNRKKKTA